MAKISDIQPQKKNKDRSNVYVNNQFLTGLPNYLIEKFGLKIGQEIDDKKIKNIALEHDYEKAKEYIIRYLMHKTTFEVEKRLKEKGYEEETIIRVMTFIKEYKIIDDNDKAKRFTNDKLKIKKQGRNRIKMELKLKGISEEDVQEAINMIDEKIEIQNAISLLEKKYETYKKKSKTEYEVKNRMFQFLMSKGYTSEVIQIAIEKIKK